jgi:hypothetical protein
MEPPPSEGSGQAARQRRAACQDEPLVKAIHQPIESGRPPLAPSDHRVTDQVGHDGGGTCITGQPASSP